MDAPSRYKKSAEWRQEWDFNENVVGNRPEVYSSYSLIQNAR
jgi:hypothetical protein